MTTVTDEMLERAWHVYTHTNPGIWDRQHMREALEAACRESEAMTIPDEADRAAREPSDARLAESLLRLAEDLDAMDCVDSAATVRLAAAALQQQQRDIAVKAKLLTKQAREIERLHERLGPRGLEVVMIGNTGHYVSEAVAREIERLREVQKSCHRDIIRQDDEIKELEAERDCLKDNLAFADERNRELLAIRADRDNQIDISRTLAGRCEDCERETAAIRDALQQCVDDFGDSYCVCDDTKQLAIRALQPAAEGGENG